MFAGTCEWHGQVRLQNCDASGAVYHANYTTYLHEARSAFLEAAGVDLLSLSAQGLELAVAEEKIRYRRPLRRGDNFVVVTSLVGSAHRAITLSQQVTKTGDLPCAESTVVLQLVLDHDPEFEVSPGLAEAMRSAGISSIFA